MKKILTTMAAVLLMCAAADAQGLFSNKEYDGGRQPRETYLKGAVTETDGKVVFTKTFEAPSLNKAEIYLRLSQWVAFRYNPSTERGKWSDANYFKNTEYARVLKASAQDGIMKIQGNEDMVFTNKTLAKDMTVVSYILNLDITDGKAVATIDNINYTYSLGETPERLSAEDWITDSESFNKAGKLAKVNGKFRVKTIDLKDELFSEIEDALH